jgi:type I restriction-modification system DNA methylase subunit
MPRSAQIPLRLGAVHNSELFSSHWLRNRLPLELEWNEYQKRATDALNALTELWREQRNRVEHYGSEQSLEQAFIQPILQILDWNLIYQTHLRGRKPDYALFLDDASLENSLQAGRLNPDFWKYPALLADAKAWHVALDRPTITDQQREYPPEQIEWYLNNSFLPYAILTNGRHWRLIPRQYDPGQPRFETYFEIDLEMLLNERIEHADRFPSLWPGFADFLQFFLFFSPAAFVSTVERIPLVERARTGSGHYRVGVGDGLKQRVFEALRLSVEGFLAHKPNHLDPKSDLEACRFNSLVLLYRLLFVLYAEDRKLLPYGIDRAYTENRSLGRFRDEIATKLDRIREKREADYANSETSLWTDLLNLFLLIDEGAARYRVPPYNGGLFDRELHPFLNDKAVPDWYLARIIDQLGRAVDLSHGDAELVRVDYRDLAIQHLGNLYEGLLELQPHYAHEDLREIRTAPDSEEEEETRIIPASSQLPTGFLYTLNDYGKGSVYLLSDKGERKSSGSYYTPNNVVDYIVEHAIGPLCEEIDSNLRAEITRLDGQLQEAADRAPLEEELKNLRAQFAERVLRIRVLDPAMGSGHFLIRACQYVAEQIATNPHTHDVMIPAQQGDESILTYWKRKVAESCLYGVDLNYMAVELAKLALWLETIATSLPLTFLDHHLRHGDSLVGASFTDMCSLPDAKPIFKTIFDEQLRDVLPNVLSSLSQIRSLPSVSVDQVKRKSKLFRKCETIRQPFVLLGDLWCSTFYLAEKDRLTLDEYGKVVEHLEEPKEIEELLKQPRYEAAYHLARIEVMPLHWELEFPEVFYGQNGSRPDAGFDVVIGNPPYDVLSEKETGKDLGGFREFLEHSEIYEPSFHGKNNLYKMFICRSLSVLGEGGRLGFITPMPLLGDDQAVGIRRAILKAGTFEVVEAFPQKDNPSLRVFKDAKLSTAITIVKRTQSARFRQKAFVSRVHPANVISEGSVSLKLTAADIPLYDPSNLTIVSCSQKDWNVAVRIMQTGRCQRLGDVCVSYQGEVNEKTDKRFISSSAKAGQLVLRGSNVTMYVLRSASQGESLYLNVKDFLNSKGPGAKAHHSKQDRIGFQRSSPQNNFRRIVSCPIPKGEFCFDTVSYVPYSDCKIPPMLLLALLNSKLLDWYFRLGSTNSKVNEYQFNNLPCPIFDAGELRRKAQIMRNIEAGKVDDAFDSIAPALTSSPVSRGVSDVIEAATARIIDIEWKRGKVSKRDRAFLVDEAQKFQRLIDRIIFSIVGLNNSEAAELEQRLEDMM